MNTEDAFKDILEHQSEFLDRVMDDRGLTTDDIDNIKAIIHETVELEHAYHWKWWTNDPDIRMAHLKDKPDQHDHEIQPAAEDINAYREEEIVDIIHFLIQEILIRYNWSAQKVAELWDGLGNVDEDGIPDYGYQGDPLNQIRTIAMNYKNMGPDYKEAKLHDLTRAVFGLAKQYMDINELHARYLEKNEENHERQEGNVEGREHYESV